MTTTTDPARGTSVPPAGKGLAAGASPAPRGPLEGILAPGQLARLGAALADAISHRDPGGDCTGCEDDPYGLCGDHAADLDRADSHLALAAELGIPLEDQ